MDNDDYSMADDCKQVVLNNYTVSIGDCKIAIANSHGYKDVGLMTLHDGNPLVEHLRLRGDSSFGKRARVPEWQKNDEDAQERFVGQATNFATPEADRKVNTHLLQGNKLEPDQMQVVVKLNQTFLPPDLILRGRWGQVHPLDMADLALVCCEYKGCSPRSSTEVGPGFQRGRGVSIAPGSVWPFHDHGPQQEAGGKFAGRKLNPERKSVQSCPTACCAGSSSTIHQPAVFRM